MTPKLVGIVLKVSNPQKLANWYKDVLGMSIKQDGTNSWICEYEKFNQSAQVKLIPGFFQYPNFLKNVFKTCNTG